MLIKILPGKHFSCDKSPSFLSAYSPWFLILFTISSTVKAPYLSILNMITIKMICENNIEMLISFCNVRSKLINQRRKKKQTKKTNTLRALQVCFGVHFALGYTVQTGSPPFMYNRLPTCSKMLLKNKERKQL